MTPAHHPIQARCPATGNIKVVKLLADLALKILKIGPKSRYHEIVGDRTDPTAGSPVQQILLNPAAIFESVREHQDGGWCYCGVPTCAYTNSGAKIPPVPNKVFCVYVNPGNYLFEWRWEPADPDDKGLPLGYQERYKVKVWPRQLETSST